MRAPVAQVALAAAAGWARHLPSRAMMAAGGALEARQPPATAPSVDLKLAASNLTYLASVEIGTPGQALELEVSTSADWTWVPAKGEAGCDGGACTHGTYNANASSSGVEVDGKTLAVVDENGAGIAGQYFNETWRVGATTVTSFSFAAGTSADRTFGSLGLGGAKQAVAGSTSLVASLAAAGLSATSAYSVWLGSLTDKTGSLLFGGVDTSRFRGTLTRLPTHPLQLDATKDGSLGVELTSVTATSPTGADALPFGTTPLLVELRLGTSLMTLPDDLVEGIWSETGAKAVVGTPGTAQIPCQMGNSPGLLSFKFAGGPRINVSMSSLVLPDDLEPASANATLFDVSDDVLCQFAIVKGGATFGLGETFLRSAYAVFDQANGEVGIAQSNPEPTSSYVIQFPSSGAFIPLATPATATTSPYPTAVASASATALATFAAAEGFQNFSQTATKAAKPTPAGAPTAAIGAGVTVGVIAALFALAVWRIGVAKKPIPMLKHIPVLKHYIPRAWVERQVTELETKAPQPAAAEAVGFPWALGQPAGWNELESQSRPTELEGDSVFQPGRKGPVGAPDGVRKRDRPVCAAHGAVGLTPPESPVTGTFPPTCTSTPSRQSVESLPGGAMTFLSSSSTTSEEDAEAPPPTQTQTVEYLGPPLQDITSSPRDARTSMLFQNKSVIPCPATPSPVSPIAPTGSSWQLVTSAVELPPATPSPPSRSCSPHPSSANVSSPEPTEPRSPGRDWV